MKIFITGGTGFIGRHVVDLFAKRQYQLMMLVRDNNFDLIDKGQIKPIIGNLSNIEEWKDKLKDFKPDVLLHLAWQGLPDYGIEMCRRNLKYGIDIFAIAAELGCQCVLSIGSCWEYKNLVGKLDETLRVESSTIFPAVKNSLSFIGEAMAEECGIKFYWPRVFFVYGPGQRETSLIPHTIASLQNGLNPEIKSLYNKNDFIYVKDVAEAIVNIIEKKPKKVIYNVGSGYSTSVHTIISTIHEVMRYEFEVSMPQESSNQIGDDFWADISNIQNDLGWSPKYSILDGIKETVAYYAGELRDK